MANSKIIAIASGKGGVGKSLIAANLALTLAALDKKTIIIDLDLGSSNLHSYLEIPNTYPGVGDYLIARYKRLDELMVPTSHPNLHFIPGDGRTPCMANIAFSEKVRLLLAIRWLKADYILLDLGGGSAFNTLDFFAMSPFGIIVTSLEYPAIMSFLVFLRNFLFRAFDRELKRFDGVSELLQEFRQVPMEEGQLTIEHMVERIAEHDFAAGEKAQQICQRYQPRIIYNFCRHPQQLHISEKVDVSGKKLLRMDLVHFGSFFEDAKVREATYRGVSLFTHYPQSWFIQRMFQVANKLIEEWEQEDENSGMHLQQETLDFFEEQTAKVEE